MGNYILTKRIRGITHYYAIDHLDEFKRGDFLRLVPEFDNPYDSNALAVYDNFGHKLGFVDKDSNAAVYETIKDTDYYCLVSSVYKSIEKPSIEFEIVFRTNNQVCSVLDEVFDDYLKKYKGNNETVKESNHIIYIDDCDFDEWGIRDESEREDKSAPLQNQFALYDVTSNQNPLVSANIQALLDRGYMALEDNEWEEADGFFEQTLNLDARLALAYIGKLLAEFKLEKIEALQNLEKPFYENKNFQKAIRFGEETLVATIQGYKNFVIKKIEEKRRDEELKEKIEKYKCLNIRPTISAGNSHIVGLKSDRTVFATGENKSRQCEVTTWKDIVAVSAGEKHSVGLKSDGTVIATGSNNSNQCGVSYWKDIIAISAGRSHTAGLRTDGTVVVTGFNYRECEVPDWKDIIAISSGDSYTVGLKSDGTVIATGNSGYGPCNCNVDVLEWKDIIAISAGESHTVGLKSDGTVVSTSLKDYIEYENWQASDGEFVSTRMIDHDEYKKCQVSEWKDIIAISAGKSHTVGLKSDGTVIATGKNGGGQCNVSEWKDIVSISSGDSYTVGLKSDGTVITTVADSSRLFEVSQWKGIAMPPKEKELSALLKRERMHSC